MSETSFEPPDHPSALTLASLARGEIPEPEKEAYANHLARCRRCMARYAEFVEQVMGKHQDTVPPDWINRAQAVSQTARDSTDTRTLKPNLKWVWGAALASGIVLVLLFFNRGHTPDSVPVALRATLAAELRADAQGSLVYGDDLPPEPRGVRGSGADGNSSMDELLDIYRARPSDPVAAYWLVAGYLARNQLRNADPFLREALQTFPEDLRFLNLAAILAYKENRLEDAKANLQKAAAKDRSATVLVNLALVRRQQGDEKEAESLLNEALSRFPDSPLSAYIREQSASGR